MLGIWFIGWILFASLVAIAAAYRYQRSGFGWFFLALAISPLLAGLFLLAVGPLRATVAPSRSLDWRGVDWAKGTVAAPKVAQPTIGQGEHVLAWIVLAVILLGIAVAVIGAHT